MDKRKSKNLVSGQIMWKGNGRRERGIDTEKESVEEEIKAMKRKGEQILRKKKTKKL